MFRFLTDLKSGLCLACGLLLGITTTVHAVPITLDANGASFGAELLTGTSKVGVIFYHGRAQSPTGDVVNQLRNNLNSNGYTTLSLSDPVPTTGNAFSSYEDQEASINAQMLAVSMQRWSKWPTKASSMLCSPVLAWARAL